MDKSRKKELIAQYKQAKPPMGVFIIRSKTDNKCYIEAVQDLRGRINGTKARLATGNHPYKELQKEWNDLGEDNFSFEILEQLEYDKDETKTDYKDDLALLQMIWEEKLTKEGLEFYKKKIH